jgi:UDP-glucose 4-epimerase
VIVVVTGGAGFVGLNLVSLLLAQRGWEVRIVDNFSNSTPERLARVIGGQAQVIKADIRDPAAAAAAVEGADAVVNLAAQTGIPSSLDDPRADLEHNVLGTFNYLEAARRAGARHFVQASSAAVLGNARPPQTEDKPSRPRSPYGASKAACEGYCMAYGASFGLDCTVLRFSNVYGPLSWSKGSVVAAFAKRALAGKPLVVNGGGTQTRDFLHVGDLAQVLALAVEGRLAAAGGAPINVATGVQTSIATLADAVAAHFLESQRPCSIERGPPREGDVAVSAPSVDRLQGLLPDLELRSLAQGLPETLDWFDREFQVGPGQMSALGQ